MLPYRHFDLYDLIYSKFYSRHKCKRTKILAPILTNLPRKQIKEIYMDINNL